jgi:folate-binding protein YgfZ
MSVWVAKLPAGFVRVTGKDRVDLLHRLSTNDLRALTEPERVATTVFANEKGRVVDWVWVYSTADALLVRTSAGRATALIAWLDRFIIMEDVRLEDVSADFVHVELAGGGAASLSGLAAAPPSGQVMARDSAWWSSGVGVDSLDVVLPVARAAGELARLHSLGAVSADEAQVEEARLRAGVPSPEHEFKDEVNPLELRLGRAAVSFTKGCYIGQEVIARLDAYDKLARVLMGFESANRLDLPAGSELKLTRDGRPLGRVTSWLSISGGTLGLAIVKREAAQPGPAELVGDGTSLLVQLVDRPFWS